MKNIGQNYLSDNLMFKNVINNNNIQNNCANANINNSNTLENNYINNNVEMIKDDKLNFIENLDNNLIYESKNNSIYESKNSENNISKKINYNLINNENYNKLNNINNLGTEINKFNKNLPLINKSQNLNINNNLVNNDFNQYKKNTIIINETSNNNTVINFIEIKNNYESNKINDELINNTQKNINNNIILPNVNQNISNNTLKNNDFWNINISNSKNLIQSEENEEFANVPDDGIINTISTSFSPNKTFSIMNKQENTNRNISSLKNNSYKDLKSDPTLINNNKDNKIITILNKNSKEEDTNNYINKINTYKTTNKLNTSSEDNSKISKFTLLDNFLYGKEFLNSVENKNPNDIFHSSNQLNNIEINADDILKKRNSNMNRSVNNLNLNSDNSNYNYLLDEEIKNENGNIIQRRTTKKLKHKGVPEKGRVSIHNKNEDYIRDYESYNECDLNLSNDLKCGCTGNFEKGCYVF